MGRAVTLRDHLRRWHRLASLLGALVAPSLRRRSAVDLADELEQLSGELTTERDLSRRVALLARLGPVARESLLARLHLGRHVTGGMPLRDCLEALAAAVVASSVRDLGAYRAAEAYPPFKAILAAQGRGRGGAR